MIFWRSHVAASLVLLGSVLGSGEDALAQTFGAAEERCVLMPWRDTSLSSAGRELVTERLVSRGDRVEQGDVLIRFFEGGLEAKRQRALAELDLARLSLTRIERLDGVVTSAERDEAQVEVRLREADVRELSLEAERFVIRAPHNGIVIDTPVNVGEALDEDAAMRVVDVNRLRAEFDLPLRYLGVFERGDEIAVADESDRSRIGSVIFVDPVVDIASRSFRLHALIDNPGEDWIAGSLCSLVDDGNRG